MCTKYNVSLQNKMSTILYLLFPYPETKNADIVATEKNVVFTLPNRMFPPQKNDIWKLHGYRNIHVWDIDLHSGDFDCQHPAEFFRCSYRGRQKIARKSMFEL